ncbi:hypothetical protein C7B64_10155 [Merismopedia glauca CCAP 1448/3]|uniref:Uncharacterized protein n=1 Tax=Merismopedia glauca CCAP 1448/3 TaxID=1296344 RepID=A0A2T1C482_9CYAN|nr:hypothetical protein C7B64_10155 [Merismopedia glauca CCAP 1448/3]
MKSEVRSQKSEVIIPLAKLKQDCLWVRIRSDFQLITQVASDKLDVLLGDWGHGDTERKI